MQGIYAICNVITGDRYIGSSGNCDRRMTQHLRALVSGRHINRKLLAAWNKYGGNAFVFCVIEVVLDAESVLNREQALLTLGEYNLTSTAGRPPGLGRRYTASERAAMSAARSGKPKPWLRWVRRSAQAKERVSIALKGHGVSTETASKISAKLSGSHSVKRSVAMLGNRRGAVPCSDAKKEKIRVALSGIDVRARIGRPHRSIPKSESQRVKMAKSQRDRWKIRHELGLGRAGAVRKE